MNKQGMLCERCNGSGIVWVRCLYPWGGGDNVPECCTCPEGCQQQLDYDIYFGVTREDEQA